MEPTKTYAAEMGLKSSLLYMYEAYTEEEGFSPEQAKNIVSDKVLKELEKLNMNKKDVQSGGLKDKTFLLKDMERNINMLLSYNNKQVQFVAKALQYSLNQLMKHNGLK